MKYERLVPYATDSIDDIKRKAEERNPGFLATAYTIEGPVFVVTMTPAEDVPETYVFEHYTDVVYQDTDTPENLDIKCACGRYRRDCSHPLGWQDDSQARHALSNRDLGITDGFGRRPRW